MKWTKVGNAKDEFIVIQEGIFLRWLCSLPVCNGELQT